MNGSKEHTESLRRSSIWFCSVFLSVLVIVGLISIIREPGTISVTENRPLAPMPHYSTWALFSGSYADSLEFYYADNFPARDALVGAATTIRDVSGYRSEVVFYQAESVTEGTLPEIDTITPVPEDSVVVKNTVDTTAVVAEFAKSAGVIVYGDRAVQLFTGSNDGARKFAEMVNLYRSTFDTLDIFCLVAPTPIDFYLPDEYKRSSNYEYKTIDLIRDSLDSVVHFVDAYSELGKHRDEYIFFNTDHHWTGLGAYYAYVAFCRSAGMEAVPLADFERKRSGRKFLGSLYGITLDKRLKDNRDSMEYYRPFIATRTYRYNRESERYELSRLFSGTHNYANFIGGDHPMVRIESDVNSGRLLIIKDSFGNAVAPFLALHYGTVYVMDYRYFDINVRDFVRQNKISAILFLHNTFAANSKYTAYRGRYLLNWRPAMTSPDFSERDSANNKANEE